MLMWIDSWCSEIDFSTIHLQKPPFVPDLQDETDTRYFEDEIDANPLAPVGQVGGVDSTRDPLLNDRVHGAELLEMRKQHAFVGYTFKGPKREVFDPRRGVLLNPLLMSPPSLKPEVVVEQQQPELVDATEMFVPITYSRSGTNGGSVGGSRIRSMSLWFDNVIICECYQGIWYHFAEDRCMTRVSAFRLLILQLTRQFLVPICYKLWLLQLYATALARRMYWREKP